MKKFLMVTLLSVELLFGVTKYVQIGEHKFKIVQESYNIYDSKGTYIRFYSSKSDENSKPLLRLTLADVTGNCTSKSLEDGAYEIDGNRLILYTSWSRRGNAYLAPYGVMIQEYKVEKNGKLKKISAQIYQEIVAKGYDTDSGMKYLFDKPTTSSQKEKFSEYITTIEKSYNATFVFGEEAKTLRKKVTEALIRKVKKSWRVK